jgi:hypothetical protein
MYHNEANQHVVTTHTLTDDNLNQWLVTSFRDNCTQAKTPSSYRLGAGELLEHEAVAKSDACVALALPGYRSVDIPPVSTAPEGIVATWPEGRVACLSLRGNRVWLPIRAVNPFLPSTTRLLLVYLFEDGAFMDVVSFTEELHEYMGLCELVAQSHAHPSYEELVADSSILKAEFPVTVRNNRLVKFDEETTV